MKINSDGKVFKSCERVKLSMYFIGFMGEVIKIF